MRRLPFAWLAAAVLFVYGVVSVSRAASIRPGEILVNNDPSTTIQSRGTLRVDPVTGEITPFVFLEAPNGIAVDADGTVLVVDGFFDAAFRFASDGHLLRRYDGLNTPFDLEQSNFCYSALP